MNPFRKRRGRRTGPLLTDAARENIAVVLVVIAATAAALLFQSMPC